MRTTEKATEAHEILAAAIEQIETDDDWRAALDVAARFHSYSFQNRLLLAAQAAARGFEPTRVAGYRKWQELGRQVRKGERGLAVLAPMRRKREDETTGDEAYVVVGFRAATVFDISQTDGDDLPEIPMPVDLVGDAPGAIADLIDIATGLGFQTHLSVPDRDGAKGSTNWTTKTIRVDPDLSQAQIFKTMIHELGHVLLHAAGSGRPDCRGVVEVEAESVAYVVARTLGLDTTDYTFPYVAGWAVQADEKGTPSDIVRRTGDRVVKAATVILGALSDETEEDVA